MTDRPIIFSAPMVRALLDGRKTQTRRLAWITSLAIRRLSIGGSLSDGCEYVEGRKPSPWQKVAAGDRLWVREHIEVSGALVQYAADRKTTYLPWPAEWRSGSRPSIHMPRWASRITLTVTEIRRQRLHEIAEDDAAAEGAERMVRDDEGKFFQSNAGTCRCGFAGLWAHLHGASSWDANPQVIALTFTVERRNIDAGSDARNSAA